MCKNATQNIAALLTAIKPTVQSLLSLEGLASTTEGTTAINALDAAITAAQSWTPGDTTTVVIDALNAFVSVFNALPIPTTDKALANVIEAGIVTALGILKAHTPASPPAATTSVASGHAAAPHATLGAAEALLAGDAETASVDHATVAQVQALVPDFKPSFFHSPQSQYTSEWNKTVTNLGGKYTSLKQ